MPVAVHLRSTFQSAANGKEESAIHRGVSSPEVDPARQPVAAAWRRDMAPNGTTAGEIQLVAKLFFLNGTDVPRVPVFCGIESSDGAELVCARAAEVLAAQVREPVCIVDCGPSGGNISLRYGVIESDEESGRSDHISCPNLSVLSLNKVADYPTVVSPEFINDKISRLRHRFGYVLISAPPLSVVHDGLLWGQVGHGIVTVMLASGTNRFKASKARADIERYNVRMLGVVLNEAPHS